MEMLSCVLWSSFNLGCVGCWFLLNRVRSNWLVDDPEILENLPKKKVLSLVVRLMFEKA